jgi:hypothetical protein
LAILPCVSGTIKVPSILFLFVMIFLFLWFNNCTY